MPIKVLGLCRSARRDSLNRKLLDAALLGACDAGAAVTQIRLANLKLPIYDGDAEAEHGLPDGVHELKYSIAEHQALLIATPEHNGGQVVEASRPTGAVWTSFIISSTPHQSARSGKHPPTAIRRVAPWQS